MKYSLKVITPRTHGAKAETLVVASSLISGVNLTKANRRLIYGLCNSENTDQSENPIAPAHHAHPSDSSEWSEQTMTMSYKENAFTKCVSHDQPENYGVDPKVEVNSSKVK